MAPETRSSQREREFGKRIRTGHGPGSDPEESEAEMGTPPDPQCDFDEMYHRLLAKVTADFERALQHSQAAQAEAAQLQIQQAAARIRTEFEAKLTAERERSRSVVAELQGKIVELTNRVEGHDRTRRENNLVLHNMKEGERPAELSSKVQRLLPEVQGSGVVEVKRIGPPRQDPAAKPRPVLVRFTTSDNKHAALKSSRQLRQQQLYLDQDLTAAQQRARTSRRGRYLELKEHGARPFWRYDRLYYTDSAGHVVLDTGAPVPRPAGTRGAVPRPAPPAASANPTAHTVPPQVPQPPPATPSAQQQPAMQPPAPQQPPPVPPTEPQPPASAAPAPGPQPAPTATPTPMAWQPETNATSPAFTRHSTGDPGPSRRP